MSTIEYIRSRGEHTQSLDGKGLRIAIAVADWNSNITHKLLEGAVETLKRASVEEIKVMHVPGAFELTNAAARLRQEPGTWGGGLYDAVIVIGCVVRGDTPHFDYVCQGVTHGISMLNATPIKNLGLSALPIITPVIFCVLTTDTMEQAEVRAGGALGNKGEEAAEAAILMCRPVTQTIKP